MCLCVCLSVEIRNRIVSVSLLSFVDPQKDYENLLLTWKLAFTNFQKEFKQWKNDQCPREDD